MARVIQGLASIGYLGSWRTLRASDIGACHQRRRVFILAAHTDRLGLRAEPRGPHGEQETPRPIRRQRENPDHEPGGPGEGRLLPTPAAWDGARGPDFARQRDRAATGSGGDDLTTAVAKLLPTPTSAMSHGGNNTRSGDRSDEKLLSGILREAGRLLPTPQARDEKEWTDSRATPETIGRARGDGGAGTLVDLARLLPTPIAADARSSRNRNAAGELYKGNTGGNTLSQVSSDDIWGDYAEAIARHETATGEPAPDPVDGDRRLNPAFVEWMMMLPPGWVTDPELELARTHQLRILGNGVVPHQAATAYRDLLTRLEKPLD